MSIKVKNQKKQKKQKNSDAVYDKHASKLEIIREKNSTLLKEYNNKISNPQSSNRTLTNIRTHMTYYNKGLCLRNRFWYLINSLTIANGIKKNKYQMIGNNDYGGIIIYYYDKNNTNNNNNDNESILLNGLIYMLDVKTMSQTSQLIIFCLQLQVIYV